MQFVIKEEGELNGWPTYAWAVKRLPKELAKAETVKEVVETAAEIRGDKTYAIYADTGESMTYHELNKDANRIANALLELGVQKGDRVGSLSTKFPRLSSMYLCVFKDWCN